MGLPYDTMTYIAEMVNTNIQSLIIDKLHAKQKKDIHCRNLGSQSHKNKDTFNPVMISPDGPLQNHQCVHGLNYDITIALNSIVPIVLHEIHYSKGHQGTLCIFEVM